MKFDDLQELLLEAPPKDTEPAADEPAADEPAADEPPADEPPPDEPSADEPPNPDRDFKPDNIDDETDSADGEEGGGTEDIGVSVEKKLLELSDKVAESFEKDIIGNESNLDIFLKKASFMGARAAMKSYLKDHIKNITDAKTKMFTSFAIDKFTEIMTQKLLGKLL